MIYYNLIYYKKLGIEGVFFNGSESYSILQELKATILARLLINANLNLSAEIKKFFQQNYPAPISSILSSYYLHLEDNFLRSNKKQGIYSSIAESIEKYLDITKFCNFYSTIVKSAATNLSKSLWYM